MKVAILSDIHSNIFAFTEVIADLKKQKITKVLILGDIFGYCPWAAETYQEVVKLNAEVIKGNHDALVFQKTAPDPLPEYWAICQSNYKELVSRYSEVEDWYLSLSFSREISVDGQVIKMFHGTPEDPENGRYYPDDSELHDWVPGEGEVMVLGHTHYPLLKESSNGGMIINPGSVGQPRDGDIRSSWAVFDTETGNVEFVRTEYDVINAQSEMAKLNWNLRAIKALGKGHEGQLDIEN